VSLAACEYVASSKLPAVKPYCQPAAGQLEFYMGRYVAPKMSDWVYERANGAATLDGSLALAIPSELAFERDVLGRRN